MATYDNTKIIRYGSKAVAVGPTPASGFHILENGNGRNTLAELTGAGSFTNTLKQLHRLTNVSFNYSAPSEDINQLGQTSRVGAAIISAPDVSLSLGYLATNGINEKRIGLDIGGQVSAISGFLAGSTSEKNWFILSAPQGVDAIGATAEQIKGYNVIGIGNGFVTDYSFSASVGSFPEVSLSVEGRELSFYVAASGVDIPALNGDNGRPITGRHFIFPTLVTGEGEPLALRHGDISLEIGVPFGPKVSGIASLAVQSVDLNVSLARERIEKFGTQVDFSRELQLPIDVTMNVNGLMTQLVEGQLSDVLCSNPNYTLDLTIREPSCDGLGPVALRYTLKNAKLESQDFSLDIGSNETVSLSYRAQAGAANDTANGIFISGSHAGE